MTLADRVRAALRLTEGIADDDVRARLMADFLHDEGVAMSDWAAEWITT